MTREDLKTSGQLIKHGLNFLHYVDHSILVLEDFEGQAAGKMKALGGRHYGRGTKDAHYDVRSSPTPSSSSKYSSSIFASSSSSSSSIVVVAVVVVVIAVVVVVVVV